MRISYWSSDVCSSDLVLHLHLGDVRVGAGLEGQRDRGPAAGTGRRAEVIEVVDAGQLLLDYLGHRALGGRRARAGVDGGHGELWRGDVRMRRDAPAVDRTHEIDSAS